MMRTRSTTTRSPRVTAMAMTTTTRHPLLPPLPPSSSTSSPSAPPSSRSSRSSPTTSPPRSSSRPPSTMPWQTRTSAWCAWTGSAAACTCRATTWRCAWSATRTLRRRVYRVRCATRQSTGRGAWQGGLWCFEIEMGMEMGGGCISPVSYQKKLSGAHLIYGAFISEAEKKRTDER